MIAEKQNSQRLLHEAPRKEIQEMANEKCQMTNGK
jgi:hypothetical protein